VILEQIEQLLEGLRLQSGLNHLHNLLIKRIHGGSSKKQEEEEKKLENKKN